MTAEPIEPDAGEGAPEQEAPERASTEGLTEE